MLKNSIYPTLTFSLLFIVLFTFTPSAYAQMFSVQESISLEERALFDYSSLSFGWEVADFRYRGSEQVADADRSDFNDGVFRVNFENPGLDMYLGIAGGLTGMEDHNYLNIGAVLHNDFVVKRFNRSFLILPLQINTDLKRSQKDNSNQQFQQSAFLFGAGLGLRSPLPGNVNLLIKMVPGYGFSFSQGSLFGGSIFKLDGTMRLYIHDIFRERALLLGYDYQFNRYNIDGEIFDYDFNGHSITIGITF